MRPMRKIRVLVVDDSMMFREVLTKRLSADPGIEVVGTASDAFEALEKIKQLSPDVVSLDVEMPKVDGIAFLKKLMPMHPTRVVVVTSLAINAFEALDAGAVDFVRKPGTTQGVGDVTGFISELLVKIKIASIAQIKHVAPKVMRPSTTLKMGIDSNIVIAMGASTGGTEALLAVLKELPATTPGIVIVQHMPPVFTKMYAERLDKICAMSVKEAENNDRVERGKVIIGAGGFHLTLERDTRGYYVKSSPGDKVSGHCPSVDVLFDSVSKTAGGKAIGVILTGMGADGANGLLKMRHKGSFTIGQDKDSCVVYGMPMVAFNIGAVARQLPLDAVSSEIIAFLNKN